MSIFQKISTDLKFALDHNYNVLLSGLHGCGKTLTVMELFNQRFGEGNWVYMSAPTLDPYVDFIGCPRVVKNPHTGKQYLELVKPERFAEDKVKAIFIDEIPRAPSKVKNALMEILLFKTINGQKYNNLEVIWAAENPVNEGYAGEELDDAIKDRFPIQIAFPYEINFEYFEQQFNTDYANAAKNWWDVLDKEIKRKVSPRRLESAIRIIVDGGDVNNVLPKESNPSKLIKEISSGSILEKLKIIMRKKKDRDALLREFFETENNYFSTKDYIIKQENSLIEYLSDERICELISNNNKIRDYVLDNLQNNNKYIDIIYSIVDANTNPDLVQEIKKNINYHHVIIDKEANNPKLLELNASLKGMLGDDNSKIFNTESYLDTDARYADFDTLDHKSIYKFIEKNAKELAGSDLADEVLVILHTKFPKLYSKAPEVSTIIREYGC